MLLQDNGQLSRILRSLNRISIETEAYQGQDSVFAQYSALSDGVLSYYEVMHNNEPITLHKVDPDTEFPDTPEDVLLRYNSLLNTVSEAIPQEWKSTHKNKIASTQDIPFFLN